MNYYHYTKAITIREILLSGKIKRPLPEEIDPHEGKIPCVWFSSNERWTNAAGKLVETPAPVYPLIKHSVSCSPDLLLQYGWHAIIPARIRLNPNLIKIVTLDRWLRTLPREHAQLKLDVYKAMNVEPSEVFVTYNDVPASSFILPVELWNGDKWIPHPDPLREYKPNYIASVLFHIPRQKRFL